MRTNPETGATYSRWEREERKKPKKKKEGEEDEEEEQEEDEENPDKKPLDELALVHRSNDDETQVRNELVYYN